MELDRIGEVIKAYREKYQVSRDEIATNECDVSTIYRIEEGLEKPTQSTLKEIFGSLGIGMPVNLFPATYAEYERYLAEEKIIECTEKLLFSDLQPLLEIYKDSISVMDSFESQFYFLHKGIYNIFVTKKYEEAVEELKKALNETKIVLNENLDDLKDKFITINEMECIKYLALAENGLHNRENAKKLFRFILCYIEKGRCAQISERRFVLDSLLNLCQWAYEENDIKSLREYSRKGIRVCLEHGVLSGFLQFHFYEGKATAHEKDSFGNEKAKICESLIHKYKLELEENLCVLTVNKKHSSLDNWNFDVENEGKWKRIPIVCHLLKDIRKKKKMTQEEVCRGICTKATLSRIENGQIIPSLNQIRIFFTRMGVMPPKKLVAATKWQKRRYDLEAMMQEIWVNDSQEQYLLLQEYKNVKDGMNVLEKQVYLYNQAIHESMLGGGREEAIRICKEALILTNTEFDIDYIYTKQRLSYIERNLINFIAHCRYYLYEVDNSLQDYFEKAVSTEKDLKEYHERYIDNFKNIRLYTAVIYNLTNWKGNAGIYEEALNLSKEGFESSYDCNSLFYFMTQLYNQAYILIGMNKPDYALGMLRDFSILSKLSPQTLEPLEIYLADIKDYLNYDLPPDFNEELNRIFEYITKGY